MGFLIVQDSLTLYSLACILATTMIPMYSTKEAAQRLGLDESQIRRLLQNSEIQGKKIGRDWVVLELKYKRKRKPKAEKGESDAKS